MIYTFGSNHTCPQCAAPLGRCYVELPSRDAMVALFGSSTPAALRDGYSCDHLIYALVIAVLAVAAVLASVL